MALKEGQIYQGNISLTGGSGEETQNWIVVAPFDKMHIHSIDDPLELHCWPIFSAQKGLEEGHLKLITTDIHHPVVLLQHAKEALDIPDTHMGLHGESLRKMFELLEQAVATGKPYAPFAAGEILALTDRTQHSDNEVAAIREQVNKHLQAWDSRQPPVA